MGHLFISYAHKNAAFVDRLIPALGRRGVEVWMDRSALRGGDAWRAAITDAVRECDAFLVVLSKGSAQSENVAKEVALAIKFKRRILPVRLEECELSASMDYDLAGVQWVDFAENEFDAGLDGLTAALGVGVARTPASIGTVAPEVKPPVVTPPPANVAPPPPPPTAWTLPQILPGTWAVQITNALGFGAQGTLVVMPGGQFQGQLMTPLGLATVQGTWQVNALNQMTVQGTRSIGWASEPFVGFNQFLQVTPNRLVSVDAEGSQGIWQRQGTVS